MQKNKITNQTTLTAFEVLCDHSFLHSFSFIRLIINLLLEITQHNPSSIPFAIAIHIITT